MVSVIASIQFPLFCPIRQRFPFQFFKSLNFHPFLLHHTRVSIFLSKFNSLGSSTYIRRRESQSPTRCLRGFRTFVHNCTKKHRTQVLLKISVGFSFFHHTARKKKMINKRANRGGKWKVTDFCTLLSFEQFGI